MASFHREAIHRCPYCTYKSYFTDLYEKHQRIHTKYLPCTFDKCTESFLNQEKLDAHVNRFHLNDPAHRCTVEGCTEAFFNVKNLNKHRVEVHKQWLHS